MLLNSRQNAIEFLPSIRVTISLPSPGTGEKLSAFMKLRRLDFRVIGTIVAICASSLAKPAIAEESAVNSQNKVLKGHSYHGEAFNEGPRQSAYLMKGMGRVRFSITTSVQEAQLFFTQGVAQLHGFWFFEAERSFRQAAMLDPDCAMAYWGMAVAQPQQRRTRPGILRES